MQKNNILGIAFGEMCVQLMNDKDINSQSESNDKTAARL